MITQRNQAWSLPFFFDKQLYKQAWPMVDHYTSHVAVINIWQGQSKKLRINETENSGVWELKKNVLMSCSTPPNLLYWSFFCIIFYPDDKSQRCASLWSYQLWWWKRKLSKRGHHLFNHKITHQMTGSHSDPRFNSPHLHLVIIIRPSVRLIGVMLQ